MPATQRSIFAARPLYPGALPRRMDYQPEQAFADCERFLMGQSAPALVGHALATVVRQDMKIVADRVVRRAYGASQQDRLAVLLALRNKVYDIFFYRIVRFRRIYEFFPR